MKKLFKLTFFFSFLMLFVACGDDDLEPTLAQDKDLNTGINNADDLVSVMNSAYDRMTPSGYYGRNQIIMGDVRTDNLYSNVNSGSDHGYLWWYDDNNNYANNSNTENGVLVIGVQNDAANSVTKDAVAIESTGDIWLNPGTTNDSYGGASGPNFTNGKVYIGRETTKYQVWHEGNDGSGSTLDADKLDGQEGSYYQNAGNLNAGTIPDARLANSSLFVTGMILMYTGNSAPSGWAICNGQNGTPDLRDRFIVGAGSAYSVNNTGGAASVTLTTAQLPAHSHTTPNHNHSFSATTSSNTHNHIYQNQVAVTDASERPWPASNNDCRLDDANTSNNTHSHTVSGTTGNANPTTNNTGSGNSHENRPPYYALMFIMKL